MYNYQKMINTISNDWNFLRNIRNHYDDALSAEKMFCKTRLTEVVLRIANEEPEFIVNRD